MILLPYYTTNTPIHGTHAVIHALHVLTIGGTGLWTEVAMAEHVESVVDLLEGNGILLASPPQRVTAFSLNFYLCAIDPVKTPLADFYRWNELDRMDHDTFCWRSFYSCGTPYVPQEERLGTFPLATLLEWMDPVFQGAQPVPFTA